MEKFKQEVKDDVCKMEGVVKTLTEEMTEMKGALNKEKAEWKLENEALEIKIEKKIETESRRLSQNMIGSQ